MSQEYFKYKEILFSKVPYSKESLSFAEEDFEVRDDDVFLVTYPKSGTFWMIEILSLIQNNGDPTWNRAVPTWERLPWLETADFIEKLKNCESTRMFSSHLPIQLFAKSFFKSKAKVIYTMRNPKDVLVSMYHYAKCTTVLKTPNCFEELLNDFLEGRVPFGSWFDHMKGWTEMKDPSKYFFITYEELHQDPRDSVLRICKFLGKELDAAAIDGVVENSTFKVMKTNCMCNGKLIPERILDRTKGTFLRKGIPGDWKNLFTVDQNERFDRVYKERMNGLKMKWDEMK